LKEVIGAPMDCAKGGMKKRGAKLGGGTGTPAILEKTGREKPPTGGNLPIMRDHSPGIRE